jgi:hypothetical protein
MMPTPSIAPNAKEKRQRTIQAGYNPQHLLLSIQFRSGEWGTWVGVPPTLWRQLQAVDSTGRFVDQVLSRYPLARHSDGFDFVGP